MTATKKPKSPARQRSWKGRDLIALRTVETDDIRLLLTLARRYAEPAGFASSQPLAGRTVGTLFFEDSTRTKTSFALAARRLGASVADLSGGSSSLSKGETLVDTARNVEAMGMDAIVVRARFGGAASMIARAVTCPVINAGDGRHEHPTQGLLDVYTIAHAFDRLKTFDLKGLRVAIVGDINASRVARSAIAGLKALGAASICVGPPALVSPSLESLGCSVTHDLDSVVPSVDVVMMLRIQFERYGDAKGEGHRPEPPKGSPIASVREYRELYSLTPARAATLRKSAIVMHPGPMNRGIEIDADVADGPHAVILTQVSHGVAVRAAVLASVIGGGG